MNFFTCDVEEWYDANYDGIDREWCRRQPSNLEASLSILLEMCARHGVTMTCFVLGRIGREQPRLVRQMHGAGHEVASHGCGHEPVSRMTPERFREDVRVSCAILEDLTGEKVLGFRAPAFSVDAAALGWYYDTLDELGLAYSSSVFPGRTFHYGIHDFPERMHRPEVNGRRSRILEIPAPVVRVMGRDVGLYPRLFPARFMRRFITRRGRRGLSTFVYVHPREVDAASPRLPLPQPLGFIHHFGVRSCAQRLDALLGTPGLDFRPMREALAAAAAEP